MKEGEQMNAIKDWIVSFIGGGLADFLQGIQSGQAHLLSLPVIKNFTDFFQSVGGLIAAISVVIALFTALMAQHEGQNIRWATFVKNLIMCTVIATAGNTIVRFVYQDLQQVFDLVLQAIDGDLGSITNTVPGFDNPAIGGFEFFALMYYAWSIMSIFFQVIERTGYVVLLMVTLHFYHPEIMLSNYGSLIGWGKRFLVLILSSITQLGLMKVGLYTISSVAIPGLGLIPGIALIAVGKKAPQILSEIFNSGLGSQGRGLGTMAMQSVNSVAMLVRAFK